MSFERELAFRYDLFITPDWRDRFDTLVNESVEIPVEGRVLDVNCGTGAHSIEIAERLRGKGELVGVDPSIERIELARAKALARKLDNVTFQQGVATGLPFADSVGAFMDTRATFDSETGSGPEIPAVRTALEHSNNTPVFRLSQAKRLSLGF